MSGLLVCHGSPVVRDRLVEAASAVLSLAPVRAAGSAEELLLLARRATPAILLLDAHLPGTGPIEAIRRLRMMAIHTAIVMIAVPGDEIALDRAIALGARGYLAPDVGSAELAAVSAHVLTGPVLPSPNGRGSSDRRTAAASEGGYAQQATAQAVATGTRLMDTDAGLTRRELEVLGGMSHGRSNSQIGADLFLSEDTVKTHARRLFRKLGASDRAQAVAIGLRRGLIT